MHREIISGAWEPVLTHEIFMLMQNIQLSWE